MQAGSHSKKMAALHHACFKNYGDVCRLLLSWGADPHLKDISGEDAKTLAQKKGHKEIIEMIEQSATSAGSNKKLVARGQQEDSKRSGEKHKGTAVVRRK